MRYFWEILADTLTPARCARWARRFGKHQDTVRAWSRPPESDNFPTGTGKNSYLDHLRFIVRDIHKTHPGEAREIVEILLTEVEELDHQAGVSFAIEHNSINQAFAKTIQESARVIAVLAAEPDNPANWRQARIEIDEAISAIRQLDGCLEKLLEKNNKGRYATKTF